MHNQSQLDKYEFSRIPNPKTPCPLAHTRTNMNKNRYSNIKPAKHTRVLLHNDTWINANFVDQHRLILTQAPKPNTMLAFWQMVWEYRVPVIIMLCDFIESGRRKADPYWPQHYKNQSVKIKSKGLTLFTIEHINDQMIGDVKQTQLRLTKNKKSRTIYHLWYRKWGDFSCPSSAKSVDILRNLCWTYASQDRPPLIHCSAGVGRAGTFATIDACLRNKETNFAKCLARIRQDRNGAIQHHSQYHFAKQYVAKKLGCIK